MKFLRFAQIAAVWCVLALGGMSAHAEEAKDLLLKGDAKCTGCHDEADDAKPTMLDLHPSVLAIGKTRHGVQADGRGVSEFLCVRRDCLPTVSGKRISS